MYSAIASEFSTTRVRPWPCVERFLVATATVTATATETRGSLLDAGCGNGRNMLYANELGFKSVGFDECEEFITICKGRCLNVYQQRIELPIEGTYDRVLCIAVLHHLQDGQVPLLCITMNQRHDE